MEREIRGYFFGEGDNLEEKAFEGLPEPDPEELRRIAEESPEESHEAAKKIFKEVMDEMFPMHRRAKKEDIVRLASRFGHSRN